MKSRVGKVLQNSLSLPRLLLSSSPALRGTATSVSCTRADEQDRWDLRVLSVVDDVVDGCMGALAQALEA